LLVAIRTTLRGASSTQCARGPFSSAEPIDSILIEETDGRAVAKIGAEGVHCVAVPEQGVGIAVKVDDGAQRAQFPAVIRVLQAFDVLPAALSPRLDDFLRRPVRNTRGEVVGEIRLVA
jgi:L-asparaginase II